MQYFLRIAKAPKQKKQQQSRAIFNADAVYFLQKKYVALSCTIECTDF